MTRDPLDALVDAVRVINEARAERDRLLARLRWVEDVARTDPRPETALVRIWEGVRDELGSTA